MRFLKSTYELRQENKRLKNDLKAANEKNQELSNKCTTLEYEKGEVKRKYNNDYWRIVDIFNVSKRVIKVTKEFEDNFDNLTYNMQREYIGSIKGFANTLDKSDLNLRYLGKK